MESGGDSPFLVGRDHNTISRPAQQHPGDRTKSGTSPSDHLLPELEPLQCGTPNGSNPVKTSSTEPLPGKHKHKPSIFQSTWLLEALGLFSSATALVVIALVLRSHDGQPLPDWGPVSFNAVISLLATATKMAALYGATSALSQMKWAWFAEHDRNLADFKTFDSGSRGLLGAGTLMWHLRARHLVLFGPLAIILGAALDPFAQQVVHYYQKEFPDDGEVAWLSKADNYTALGPQLISNWWTYDTAFKANTITALYQSTQETLTQPRFGCVTGNCTWAPFTTLAFCPVCVNVTSALNKTCEPYNSTTPAGQRCSVSFQTVDSPRIEFMGTNYTASAPSYMVINSTSPAKAVALSNATWPYNVFQSISAAVDPRSIGGGQDPNIQRGASNVLNNETRFIGTECTLSPCVLSLSASVSQGIYKETVLKTWSQVDQDFGTIGPVRLSPPWGPEDGMGTGQTFHIPGKVVEALGGSMSPLGDDLKGRVMLTDAFSAVTTFDSAMEKRNEVLMALFFANFTDTTCPTPEDRMACTMRALGAGATKAVRDAPGLANGTEAPWVATGTTNKTGTFIRVDWVWLTLPIAVWVLSVTSVIIAAAKTRRVPLWRDDALPLAFLFKGGKDLGDDRAYGTSGFEHHSRAEVLKVRLVSDKGTMKFLTDSG